MHRNLTPWARSALGPEAMERLKLHLAHDLWLDVGSDGSPYRFRVLLTRHGLVVAERREVGRGTLFETVAAMLQEAGEPLPTAHEFERIKAMA